eukprot:15485723-Alexandrium_andersonii.AAC.1
MGQGRGLGQDAAVDAARVRQGHGREGGLGRACSLAPAGDCCHLEATRGVARGSFRSCCSVSAGGARLGRGHRGLVP